MSFWNDMPPLVEQPFIPPSSDAQLGQSGYHDPYAAQSAPNWSGTPYPSHSNLYPPPAGQLPAWLQPNSSPAPPTSAQSWTYGQNPAASPAWAPLTPGASWGAPTPALSYGPHTPASPYSPYPPPNSYFPPPAQDSMTPGWYGGASKMKRASSQSPAKQKLGTIHRSASNGQSYSPYPAHPQGEVYQGEVYDERNLARRPRDWRDEYSAHGGISSYIPRVGKSRSDVKEFTDNTRRTLHPLLMYTTQDPPILLDLRMNPLEGNALNFLHLGRPHNNIDFAQLATNPPASHMRLFHPRLPWYIDIYEKHPNGVTVFDVLTQMWQELLSQITGRHYWNEDLSDVDRAAIAGSFQTRCNGDEVLVARGVTKVDYLGRRIIFEGLVRTRGGMWELKTRKYD